MIKFQKIVQNLISFFNIKFIKKINNKKKIIKHNLQSNKLEKKLALLIKDINAVKQDDLKNVEYKKIDEEIKEDLFTAYRLDFHQRDELNKFKEKYINLLL